MKSFLIVGTGTEVGKTYITTSLCAGLRKLDYSVGALKPIITGFNFSNENDTIKILKALNKAPSKNNINCTSPWRFSKHLSPDIASDNKISFSEVSTFCKEKIKTKNFDFLFIETAGGVMTPINKKFTMLDLVKSLDIPVIMVTANYLGMLSHTLTAYQSLKSINAKISAILISQTSQKEGVSITKNYKSLKNHMKEEIFIMPFSKYYTNKSNKLIKLAKYLKAYK